MPEELQERIVRLIDAVADKATDPSGGITRLLYSKEWVASQAELKKNMEQLGFETYYDKVGNLFGRIKGSEDSKQTILTGSHVDSVRNGGKYDGMYGIVAGITAVSYLKETYGAPLCNIEVVSFAEEEGSRFPTVFWGSKNLLGHENRPEAEQTVDNDGVSFTAAMQESGFDYHEAGREVREDIKVFLEAHIEQGNVLEREQREIGIVNNIAGQQRYTVELNGTANHAGTTPMEYRRDTLYGASKMIAGILDKAKQYGSPLVATAGFIETVPNVGNVVPGKTQFSLDIRHTDGGFLEQFSQEIVSFMKQVAAECDVEIAIDMWMDEPPVPMDSKLVACLEQVCKDKQFDYKVMHSGAGHDSQLIAKYIPTAMLFVPSKNGISHNPEEYTKPEHLEKGVRALIDTIYRLAY